MTTETMQQAKQEAKHSMKCLECGAEAKPGNWECAPGIAHRVEPRTFYILDAPTLDANDKEGRGFRNARTVIENCPPEKSIKSAETGELVKIPGGNVMFVRGVATVEDPEKIWWLDRHGHGKNTREDWLRVYFTPLEKQQMREIAISNKEKELSRREVEVNEALAAVKARKGAA